MICEQELPTVHEMLKNGMVTALAADLLGLAVVVVSGVFFCRMSLLATSNPKGREVTMIDLKGRPRESRR